MMSVNFKRILDGHCLPRTPNTTHPRKGKPTIRSTLLIPTSPKAISPIRSKHFKEANTASSPLNRGQSMNSRCLHHQTAECQWCNCPVSATSTWTSPCRYPTKIQLHSKITKSRILGAKSTILFLRRMTKTSMLASAPGRWNLVGDAAMLLLQARRESKRWTIKSSAQVQNTKLSSHGPTMTVKMTCQAGFPRYRWQKDYIIFTARRKMRNSWNKTSTIKV